MTSQKAESPVWQPGTVKTAPCRVMQACDSAAHVQLLIKRHPFLLNDVTASNLPGMHRGGAGLQCQELPISSPSRPFSLHVCPRGR